MNGSHFLIYTTEQGGFFKTPIASNGEVRLCSVEEFEEVKRTRKFEEIDWVNYPETKRTVEPVFIALAKVVDNHDFIIGSSRDTPSSREP